MEREDINLILINNNLHTPLVTYISQLQRRDFISDEDKAHATLFFHDYKELISKKHGEDELKRQIQAMSVRLNISIKNLKNNKIFVDMKDHLLQRILRDGQSTHRAIVHHTSAATAIALKTHYESLGFSKNWKRTKDEISKTFESTSVLQEFLDIIESHGSSTETLSKMGLKKTLSLLWQSLHDEHKSIGKMDTQSLKSSLSIMESGIEDLINTYGVGEHACFGGLFNGLMDIASNLGIPGAIVLRHDAEKNQRLEILRERYSLIERFKRLYEDRQKEILQSCKSFEHWRDPIKKKVSTHLRRFKPEIILNDTSQPFKFIEKLLISLKEEFDLSFDDFKKEVKPFFKKPSILVDFSVLINQILEDFKNVSIESLGFKFYNYVNFKEYFINLEQFKMALDESGVQYNKKSLKFEKEEAILFAEKFFDKEMERFISMWNAKNTLQMTKNQLQNSCEGVDMRETVRDLMSEQYREKPSTKL